MLWTRTFLSELNAWQWVAILLARVTVGLLFFLSGRGKLFVPERREQMRETLVAAKVPFPDFNAVFRCNGGICLWFSADPRPCDAARVRDAQLRDDHGDCHHRDQKHQSNVTARLAFRIFIRSRCA